MVELTEEDYLEICAVCQTKQDNIANLDNQTFAVNTAPGCGHKFCPSCIKREFQSKRQFACPRCKIMVTEGKVRVLSFDLILLLISYLFASRSCPVEALKKPCRREILRYAEN